VSGLAHRDRGPRCASDVELDQLLASDLSGLPEENRVRHHLEECGRCRARLASFQSVAPVGPAAATLKPGAATMRRRVWRAAVAVAALGVAAGIGLAVGQRFGHRHDANAADQSVARRAGP
jgi:hypothetical protein